MISAYSEMLPATVRASNAIRRRLSETEFGDTEIFYDALDLGRFPGKVHEDRIARQLAEKYATKRFDVVIALSRESLRYLLQYRDAFAPGVPIVFCCMSGSVAATLTSSPDITGAISDYDWPKTLALAARLQPSARDVVLISGASEYDRRWEEDARRDLEPYLQSYNVRYLKGLPYDALLKEVARLPRESIVLLLPVFMDGSGRPRTPRQVSAEVAKASSAPVYAPYDTFFGEGIIGGYMDTFESSGITAADLVAEILSRKGTNAIPSPKRTPHGYRVDARQLERWGFSESSLPTGAVVVFKLPTLWDQHRNLVLAAIGLLALLTAILLVLSIQMIKRRRAEFAQKESEERMAFAATSSNTGLWQYDFATKQLWATEHCRAMFALRADASLTPASFLRAVHPNDRRIAAAAIRAITYSNQHSGRGEFRVGPNGRTRWILLSSRTYFGEDGKPVKTSGVFRDITERKIAENEARQLSLRLLTVQDDERQQIAKELHDSTAQHLMAIGLNLMSLKARGPADAKTRKLCEDIEGSLDEATRELRAFTFLLPPPELESDGLKSTLHRYVDGFATRTGLKTRLSISERSDELPLAVQRSLLRVVQEALANVHRRASASQVAVTLKCIADRIHLVVSDNGTVIKDLSKYQNGVAPQAGLGITGMTARLRLLGGGLEIKTGATGTTLHGVLPVHANVDRILDLDSRPS